MPIDMLEKRLEGLGRSMRGGMQLPGGHTSVCQCGGKHHHDDDSGSEHGAHEAIPTAPKVASPIVCKRDAANAAEQGPSWADLLEEEALQEQVTASTENKGKCNTRRKTKHRRQGRLDGEAAEAAPAPHAPSEELSI